MPSNKFSPLQTPIICAFQASAFSGWIAIAIAVAALFYDKWAKHQRFLGPLMMGVCRGLNLLLGISILPDQVRPYSLLAFVPIAYIAAITLISQGEVHGSRKNPLYTAGVLYLLAMAAILGVAYHHGHLLVAGSLADLAVFDFLQAFVHVLVHVAYFPGHERLDLEYPLGQGKQTILDHFGIVLQF